ncbi:MAG: cytochrome c nitrite reductase small subunit [Spirochaetes bacterium]|nr:cytochrome c nitrite reductase small subunit [Spirochaetota bacterium]
MIRHKIIFTCGLLIIIFFFLFFGPADFYRKTSTPEYCSSCHVMEYQFSTWRKTGMHRSIKCVDCHIPHDNFVHQFFSKGMDGLKDVIYFYGRLYEDIIMISGSGKNTVQNNCIRCHENMVSAINIEGRVCWSCHRRTGHNYPMTAATD